LLTGIAAKETIVGTLSELYQAKPHSDFDKGSFIKTLQNQKYIDENQTEHKVFSPLLALSFIVFVSLYTPCVATVSSIKKTTKSNLMSLFVIFYSFFLAWIFAFAVFQIGGLIVN
jgi:ferrous iron transport protein B